MSQADAQSYLTTVLRRGSGPVASAVAPPGHTTKVVNGKAQTVTAAEAWEHSSTNQADPATVKAFLYAIAAEFHNKGDPSRSAAAIQLAQF